MTAETRKMKRRQQCHERLALGTATSEAGDSRAHRARRRISMKIWSVALGWDARTAGRASAAQATPAASVHPMFQAPRPIPLARRIHWPFAGARQR
eukprot:15456820-Alexandrium_andersonii.AAC.1